MSDIYRSYNPVAFSQFNVIHPSAKFGKNTKVGHFCIIEENVIIGDNVDIQNYVLLKEGTIIGNNCYIDSYVRSSGQNKIGNSVTIRFGATIARNVEIEDNVFISPNVMTIFSEYDGQKSKKTLIKENAFIGTSAVIGQNVIIEKGVVIGAMSYVTGNCLSENGIYIGNPIKFLKTKKVKRIK